MKKTVTLNSIIPSVFKTSPMFTIVLSIGFSLLVLETCQFHAYFFNTDFNTSLKELFVTKGWILALAFFMSFWLPSLIIRKSGPKEILINPLIKQWMLGLLINILGVGYFLYSNLTALTNPIGKYLFIRYISIYGFWIAIIVTGLTIYVRYVRYLYTQKDDQPAKIIAISAFFFLFITTTSTFIFVADLLHLSAFFNPGLSDAKRAILGNHVYVKNFGLMALLFLSYGWHIGRIADH